MRLNCCILSGRPTKDIDVYVMRDGKQSVSFVLAVQKRKKEDGADFIPVKAYGQTAEILEQYVKKGDPITVRGRLQVRDYEHPDGYRVKVYEVVADDVDLLPRATRNLATTGDSSEQFTEVANDPDLPF